MAKQKDRKELEESLQKILTDNKIQDAELDAVIRALRERPTLVNKLDETDGDDGAKITLRIFHPGKGTAYALSYHPQKWAEALSGGEKPDLAGIGHYHKLEQLFYRGIHMFQTGTMENQTSFMRRMNISAHLGAWILYINKLDPIGLLGDTHIGSKFFRPDLLERYYDRAVAEGVRKFYHTGDICAGENMYRGQVYELYAHGMDAQAKAVKDEYPKREGVVTNFITGNHDLSFWKNAGADIGKLIHVLRRDLKYLGQEEADIKLANGRVEAVRAELIPFYR